MSITAWLYNLAVLYTTERACQPLGTLVTAGVLGLVYIALAFILPISAKRQA